MTSSEPRLAADLIRQLVQPFTTSESVEQPTLVDGKWKTVRRRHHVTHESLLDQIEEVITNGSNLSDEDAGSSSFGSKPAARLDALDVLGRIRRESKERAQVLHLPRLPLRERLLRISGQIGDRPDREVKGWWVQARICTQWDIPAFKPKGAPCPVDTCEQYGTLRVHLADGMAFCTGCGSAWDSLTEVQNLGRYVNWCTEHELSRARHWLIGSDTELVECVECLPTRDAMTERAMLRAQQAEGRMGA